MIPQSISTQRDSQPSSFVRSNVDATQAKNNLEDKDTGLLFKWMYKQVSNWPDNSINWSKMPRTLSSTGWCPDKFTVKLIYCAIKSNTNKKCAMWPSKVRSNRNSILTSITEFIKKNNHILVVFSFSVCPVVTIAVSVVPTLKQNFFTVFQIKRRRE